MAARDIARSIRSAGASSDETAAALLEAARTEGDSGVLALIARALAEAGVAEGVGVLRGRLAEDRWSPADAWRIRESVDRIEVRARRGRVHWSAMGSPIDSPWAQQPGGAHLLQISTLSAGALRELLSRTHRWAVDAGPAQAPRAGVTVALLFFEDSTRTRLSFAAAGHRLGAGVLDLGAGVSSVNKGESLADTALTIEAMGVSAMVVRTREAGGAHLVARTLERAGSPCAVINAGDGRHEHPTQALLDAYALCEALDKLPAPGDDRMPFDLQGVRVGIVGDIANSRVARSGALCFAKLGARVTLCGPTALAPEPLAAALQGQLERAGDASAGSIGVAHDLDGLAGDVDALVMLRVQFERHQGTHAAFGSRATYVNAFGLDAERLARFEDALGRQLVVMHPGPMNRGLEITDTAADGPGSVVRRQVSLGVVVRTAVLSTVLPDDGAIAAGSGPS